MGVKGREQGLPVSPGAYGPVPRPDVTLTADPAVTATFVVCPPPLDLFCREIRSSELRLLVLDVEWAAVRLARS